MKCLYVSICLHYIYKRKKLKRNKVKNKLFRVIGNNICIDSRDRFSDTQATHNIRHFIVLISFLTYKERVCLLDVVLFTSEWKVFLIQYKCCFLKRDYQHVHLKNLLALRVVVWLTQLFEYVDITFSVTNQGISFNFSHYGPEIHELGWLGSPRWLSARHYMSPVSRPGPVCRDELSSWFLHE